MLTNRTGRAHRARTVEMLVAACLVVTFAASAAVAGNTIHVPVDYTSIQEAINAAVDGDEIIVAPGTYHERITFFGKAVHVRSAEGPDVTIIDASDLPQPGSVVRITNGEGRDTVLEGFTITGGTGTPGTAPTGGNSGGGIFIYGSGPTIRNCTITQNMATYGAGIGARHGSDPLIENCHIVQNLGVEDELWGWSWGAGVAIGTNSTGHILNCFFEFNVADGGGGLLTSGNADLGGILVEACTFRHNGARNGQAVNINVNGFATFVDCTFEANRPIDESGIGNTAVFIQTLVGGTGSHAVFEECLFSGNLSAGILNGGTLTVSDSSFIGNIGGAIVRTTAQVVTVTVSNSLFADNMGGGIVNMSGVVSVTDSHFLGNTGAGAIVASAPAHDSGVTIANCTFADNSTSNPLGGGAIRIGGSGPSLISGSTFTANTAPVGGAVTSMNHLAIIDNCVFENNSAEVGGAIRLRGGSIENSLIRNNSAIDGGAVWKDSTLDATITNTTIEGNEAAERGGGIRIDAGTLIVVNALIAGNSADVAGGGASHAGGTLSFENTLFCENDPDHIDGEWTNLGGNAFHDTCPECAPADLNCDGSVGVADLLILLAAWGPCAHCTPGNCPADLDGDCAVGVADLLLLLADWG